MFSHEVMFSSTTSKLLVMASWLLPNFIICFYTTYNWTLFRVNEIILRCHARVYLQHQVSPNMI